MLVCKGEGRKKSDITQGNLISAYSGDNNWPCSDRLNTFTGD